ncbi:diguanylate cyclase [Paucibacter sp. R3-3]|uniref:Diguanylate cyclase n=1 Tax=Roseateles agri TaxID=3098619 RepID=A0ABU5DN70_9BURK|nr:diguanylate cyclase [Paucibacter sp. R3-3]MDY0747579.1 diguanylate cyclase [Paucibacter sp. R3-3]
MSLSVPSEFDAVSETPEPRQWRIWLERQVRSVKFRVTMAGIAALSFGIVAITALVTSRAERDLLGNQRQRELAETVRTADILSHRLVNLQRAIQTAAHQLELRGLRTDEEYSRYLESKQVLRSLFSGLFVVSPLGEMRWLIDEASLRPVAVDLSKRSYIQRTLIEERPIISEPVRSLVSGEWIIILTVPMFDDDGKIMSILCGNLKLSSRELLDDVTEKSDADADTLVLVTDSSGKVLAPSGRLEVLKNVAQEPRLSEAFKQWLAHGSSLEPSGLELPQPGEIVTAAGVPGADWLVWRATSESDLLRPLRDAKHYAVAWALALVSILSAMLLALLSWLLSPLTALRRRVTRMADREVAPGAGWPDCPGELGELSAALREGAIEQRRLEAEKAHLLKMLSSAVDSAPIGIAFVLDDKFELVSKGFCAVLGHDKSTLLGGSIDRIFDGGSPPKRQSNGSVAIGGRSGEWLMRRADGTQFWGQLKCNPLDALDLSLGSIWTLSDITSQRDAQRELQWAASHDGLTSLANRKTFEHRVTRLVETLPRSLPAAIVYLDLDRFKPINDREGHAAGDAVLVAVARLLASVIRPGDLAARLGGDEFALLLERCDVDVALKIADKICAQISGLDVPWESRSLKIGASAGVAALTVTMADAAAWTNAADRACYAAKAAGRGVARSLVPT